MAPTGATSARGGSGADPEAAKAGALSRLKGRKIGSRAGAGPPRGHAAASHEENDAYAVSGRPGAVGPGGGATALQGGD